MYCTSKKIYCDKFILQKSTVSIKDADVKNTRWKSSTFSVWLDFGSKTSVFLNPMATLESVLERICKMRAMEMDDYFAEDINGRSLEKETLLGNIPGGEITFMKIDLSMNILRRRPQGVPRDNNNQEENNIKKDKNNFSIEDDRLVQSENPNINTKAGFVISDGTDTFNSAGEDDDSESIPRKKKY